jgi:ectoine hydroxylase-related dioxygenase (phytanoyl-CoA dioxygenase family)
VAAQVAEQVLPAHIDAQAVAAEVMDIGYAVVPDFIDPARVERLREELAPIFEAMPKVDRGDGPFSQHTHNLLEKTRAVDDLITEPALLAIIEAILGPDFQISSVVAMRPAPGDVPQRLHQDDGHYPVPRPSMPLVANTLTALDPFTADNGATLVVPGSHKWTRRVDQKIETVPIEAEPGSLLVWHGALWHAGGGNTTERSTRRSINLNFNLAWLKQRENQFIGVPADVVLDMPKPLQRLIGYQLTNFGVGTVDYRNPIETLRRRVTGPAS